MSSMLEQAIVDAAALREAALKNAEQAIIEKYAPEIRNAVDNMLNESPMGRPVRHGGQMARVTVENDGSGQVGIQYESGGKTFLVNEVELELTFDPPWTRNLISEEAKLELGFL